ncbi:MAG: fibrillarin-like rRNA/tRNA 2'-O-methyltransferase [Candidatus Woesearchaeota archaeon]|jgi:fibrillarin-like pre-rRNA processing protein
MTLQEIQQGIYKEQSKKGTSFWTKNLLPGQSVYDEKLIMDGKYRQWSVQKSKLGAALAKGLKLLPVKKGDVVLYVGASTGTTVSHVSDIVGYEGMVFAVELSFFMLRRLVFLAEKRKNIAPILADANHPETYMPLVCEADFVFQDIAQKNQVAIFLKNLKFLKPGKKAILSVKAKTIDVCADPRTVYEKVKMQLEKEVKVIWSVRLDPFEKDHAIFVVEK